MGNNLIDQCCYWSFPIRILFGLVLLISVVPEYSAKYDNMWQFDCVCVHLVGRKSIWLSIEFLCQAFKPSTSVYWFTTYSLLLFVFLSICNPLCSNSFSHLKSFLMSFAKISLWSLYFHYPMWGMIPWWQTLLISLEILLWSLATNLNRIHSMICPFGVT